jgi:hypothetical protein
MMSIKNDKNRRWAYALAGLALTLACLLTTVVVYQRLPNLPGALEQRVNMDELTQLVVPGSVDITVDKPGAYAVYYEYRSMVNDVIYKTSKQPPSLVCSLTSKRTGARVAAVPDFVETNTYQTKDQERIGVLLMSISIDHPGLYNFSCQYGDDDARPNIVVSVGPNLMWEFFNIFARVGGSVLCGLVGLILALSVSILLAVIVAAKRNQTGNRQPQ